VRGDDAERALANGAGGAEKDDAFFSHGFHGCARMRKANPCVSF
jgi:hypothetical protein